MDVEAFLHAVWDGRYVAPTYGSVEDLIRFLAVKVTVAVPTATVPRMGHYSARLFLDDAKNVFVEVTRKSESRIFDFSSGLPCDVAAVEPTPTNDIRSSRRLLVGLKTDDFWTIEVGDSLPASEIIPLVWPQEIPPPAEIAFWQVFVGLTPKLEFLRYQVSPIAQLLHIRRGPRGRIAMLNNSDVVYSVIEQIEK